MNLYKLQSLNRNYYSAFYLYIIFCGYLVNVCFSKILTNSYLIEFHQDTDRALADQIASRNGFINAGPVNILTLYKFYRPKQNTFKKKIKIYNMFILNDFILSYYKSVIILFAVCMFSQEC